MLTKCRRRRRRLRACQADIPAVQALRPHFDMVFVDIAGVVALESLLPLLGSLDDGLRPELMVVKSKALAKLQGQLVRGCGGLRRRLCPVVVGVAEDGRG